MQKILGIDYGKKRIGVAISDENASFAFPLDVLENNQEVFAKISELVKKEKIQTVVVGDPGENEIKKEVNVFVERLKEFGLSVFLEKEFMTSLHTDIFTKTKPVARQTKKEILPKKDHSAAALILQRYLDKQKFKK
ncbi:MAG: putative pre6S rRNA nuclease [Patescibacteria group bacterium]|jgi:putative Holliday junction resolvase|nr:putative pre6S rRNA nuclease [Patescibacteria group bacterium]